MVTVSRLDNGNVLVHVDCVLKSGAVRQYFVTPDAKGGSAEGVDDVPFVQILGRAQRWKTLLATGAYGSKTALARALGVDKANLTAVLRLPYLSPVIVEKVLSGELADASVRRYGRLASPFWYDQHKALGIE